MLKMTTPRENQYAFLQDIAKDGLVNVPILCQFGIFIIPYPNSDKEVI